MSRDIRQTAAPVPIEVIVRPERISAVGARGKFQVRLGDAEEIILSQAQLDYLESAVAAYRSRGTTKKAKVDLTLKLRDGSAQIKIQCSVAGIAEIVPYQMPSRSPLSAEPEDQRSGPFFKVVLDLVDIIRLEEPLVPEAKPEMGESFV